MLFNSSSSNGASSSNQSQKSWAEYAKIQYLYTEDIEPCVFEVPKRLSETKPEACTPQKLGLGPYHHRRSDLQQVANKKRQAITRFWSRYLRIDTPEDFIHRVEKWPDSFEVITRSFYDRYIDLDRQSLAWIVVVDAIFLMDFIRNFSFDSKQKGNGSSSTSSNESLVSDLMMLENQIPMWSIIVTAELLETGEILQQNYFQLRGKSLAKEMYHFCCLLTPFQTMGTDEPPDSDIHPALDDRTKHLLYYMHQMSLGVKMAEANSTGGRDHHDGKVDYVQHLWAVTQYAWSQGKEITKLTTEQIVSTYKSAKSAGIQIPEKLDKVFKAIGNFQQSILSSSSGIDHDEQQRRLLPSVSQLHDVARATFTPLPPKFGIRGTAFDEANNAVYLPIMKLHENVSEVILRNLLAYEASTSEVSSEVGDFIDFLGRMIRAGKDVKILRDAKIIQGDLPDDQVVLLFDGLRKSIIASRDHQNKDSASLVHRFGNVLKQNFSNNPVVKICSWIKDGVVFILNLLKPVAPGFAVVLLLLQFLCQIFDCRHFHLSVWSDGCSKGGASFLSLNTSQAQLMSGRKILHYSS